MASSDMRELKAHIMQVSTRSLHLMISSCALCRSSANLGSYPSFCSCLMTCAREPCVNPPVPITGKSPSNV
jgi:hypothetical protein